MFATPDIEAVAAPGGALILRSRTPLAPYEANVGQMLRRWAAEAPDRVFMAERGAGDGWREITYGQAAAEAAAIGAGLLDRGLGPDAPLMILSGNSLDHALLTLGGLLAGVPVVPVSVAYSLMSQDLGKVRAIAALVRPGLVFAQSREAFGPALAAVGAPVAAIDELRATGSADALWREADRIGPDAVAKITFTSGSTGDPKGVLNTHRMLCANQLMLAQIWPFTEATPPVLVDWLPWNHTYGGNHNVNLALKRGGTLHIDAGRPAPGLIETTVANLAAVSPTIYFNVPAGYNALLPHLERDPEVAKRFFARLQLIVYAGAALPQPLWERLEALAVRTTGEPVPMSSSWGSTETAPLATAAHYPLERGGNIGVPVPGVEVKMVPRGAKQELRVRGPNVTPGYFRRPDLTAAAFDEEGFYRIGDAGRLADPADPNRGLVFDGRIAEDFKLTTGTWVPAGKVRIDSLAAASPLLQDAVVAGQDEDYVALLVWLNPAEAARPEIAAELRARFAAYNAAQPGSSTRVGRVLVMTEPPSIDANEITDKGYVNQRATLERRHALVERLFADPPDDAVIRIP